jgi:hypothetical protein
MTFYNPVNLYLSHLFLAGEYIDFLTSFLPNTPICLFEAIYQIIASKIVESFTTFYKWCIVDLYWFLFYWVIFVTEANRYYRFSPIRRLLLYWEFQFRTFMRIFLIFSLGNIWLKFAAFKHHFFIWFSLPVIFLFLKESLLVIFHSQCIFFLQTCIFYNPTFR